MTDIEKPIVVYHVAAMGNWQEVVREQILGFREAGLTQIRVTHVGEGLDWVQAEAARQDVEVTVIRSDRNTDHYETFAMWEIERLAKEERVERPILYAHTKGVSDPHNRGKTMWRHVMEYHVIHKWRENVGHLKTHDAVGWNFWFHRGSNHFSGNFWIANPDWIRKLPAFTAWHNHRNRERFSCEMWIGSTPGCRAMSHGCKDVVSWEPSFDWTPHLPRTIDSQLHPTITWVTAATPRYADDLTRLTKSAGLLGPGHQLVVRVLDYRGPWRHTIKLDVLRRLLPTIDTSHVFWIDSDCEFLTIIRPTDLINPAKPLSVVRHFGSTGPLHWLPDRLKIKVTWETTEVSWQACLFGGSLPGMGELLAALRWMDIEGEGYDEHGLVIELDRIRDRVHTLPCRYAAPSSFRAFPEFEATYRTRSGGAARIAHHNRESHQ